MFLFFFFQWKKKLIKNKRQIHISQSKGGRSQFVKKKKYQV